jgi:uncharacterized protein YeaC (DUF1315 family)
MSESLLDAKELIKLIDFDGQNYIWREREINPTYNISKQRAWNTRYANKPILMHKCRKGYLWVNTKNTGYLAHRLIWAFHNGEWPDGCIDHINGDRSDNSMVNLRVVTHSENNKNAAMRKDNTSGHTGVSWSKPQNKWLAQIKVNRKSIGLGFFDNKQDAISARKEASEKYGFHKNHGRA